MSETRHVIDWPHIPVSSCLADGYGNRSVGPCGLGKDHVFI